MRSRYLLISLSIALVIAACGEGISGDPTDPVDDSTTTTAPTSITDPGETSTEGPSALDNMNDPSFPDPLVDPAEIISGGPPPDGIPPIDNPRFIDVDAADEWIGDTEPVVYLEANGEIHAYPIQVLIWHEIVNDTVGDIPVAVTYCPLCNSAVSYRREVAGEVTTFGTSGRLFASALVMYDRATESLWTHFDGRAVVGVLTGEVLEPISSPLLAWSDFKEAFPEALVLDRDTTGFDRPYGVNPYDGYDNQDTNPFLFRGTVDDRAQAKQRVVGVTIDGEAVAWTLDSISGGDARTTHGDVGDTPIVIFWKQGQSSALDASQIVNGRDIGSVGVFSPQLDGRTLTFQADGDGFIDDETSSLWDITGRAVSGDLAGAELDQIHHLDTFWFAWSTYQPGSDLIED
ncbi:DUF3179 domain-containing protein [soil metagenome]